MNRLTSVARNNVTLPVALSVLLGFMLALAGPFLLWGWSQG